MSRLVRTTLIAFLAACLAGCGNSLTAEEHLARAESFVAEGKQREARVELRNAIAQNPNLPQARLRLGEAQLELGDSEAAVREFERALDLGVEGERIELGLNRAKVRVGRYNEVLGDLAERKELSPEFAAVVGEAWLGTGDLARAQSSFEQAGKTAAGRSGLGAVAAAQGDVATARRYYDEALALAPGDAETWLRKGNLEMAAQRPGDAETAYKAAMALPAGELMGQFGLARAQLAGGKLDDARANINGVLGDAPKFAGAHYVAALIRFQQKDFDGAEAALEETRRYAPDYAASDYLLATIKYQRGDRAAAQTVIERFLKREPDNAAGHKMLASLLIDKSDFEGAAQTLEDAVETTDDAQLLAIYGTAQLRLGQATKASEAFGRAVELAPDMAQFRNQLALSLMSAGEPARAEATLTSAVEVAGGQFESEYLLAMLHLQQRDWEAANQVIERLAAANPESPIPDQLRGTAQQLKGEGDQGEAAFRRALAKDAGYLPAVQSLALIAEQGGDRAGAKQLFSDLLQREPDNGAALTALGELALRERDIAGATGYFERAVAADPGALRPSIALARAYVAQQRSGDAARVVRAALQRFPKQADLLAMDAELSLAAGDPRAAQASLAALQSLARSRSDNGALQAAVGNLEMRLGQTALARASLERAAAAGGRTAAQARLGLARLALLDRDSAKASQLLTQIEADGTTGPEVELLRADIMAVENRRGEAMSIYRKLMSQGVREGYLRQAGLQLSGGEHEAAVTTLEEWVERQPGDDGARLQLANALMQIDPKRALPHYERLESTGNPVALNNLAWLYMESGDDRAAGAARKALAAAPDNPDVLDTAGWVLLKTGEHAEALRLLRRSAELNPKNPSILYHLGIALRDTGDKVGARNRLEQALASGAFPEERDARVALGQLNGS